jgi:Uma2 family endonuclease
MMVKPDSDSAMDDTVKRPWTYDELQRLPDDGNRYEIIDGELYVSPSPKRSHQEVLGMLHHLLMSHLDVNPVGKCYMAPFDVIFGELTVVEPDLLFVSNERLAISTEGGLTAAPDLVVEVLSDSTWRRDVGVKFRLYESRGVREYWIVDPDERRVEIHALESGALVKKVDAKTGDVASPAVLPGFTASLAKLFA